MPHSKYTDFAKDELVEEIKYRRAEGREIKVDLRANNETLIAALEMDDVEGGSSAAPIVIAEVDEPVEFSPLKNQLPLHPEAPTSATQPHPDEFVEGFLAKHKGDGYTYQVIKAEGDDLKPFKARVPNQASGHPGLYWEGSAEEFTAAFDKV